MGVVASDAATWRTGRNVHVDFDSGLFPAFYENMASSTQLKYISEIRRSIVSLLSSSLPLRSITRTISSEQPRLCFTV